MDIKTVYDLQGFYPNLLIIHAKSIDEHVGKKVSTVPIRVFYRSKEKLLKQFTNFSQNDIATIPNVTPENEHWYSLLSNEERTNVVCLMQQANLKHIPVIYILQTTTLVYDTEFLDWFCSWFVKHNDYWDENLKLKIVSNDREINYVETAYDVFKSKGFDKRSEPLQMLLSEPINDKVTTLIIP